VDEGTLIVDVTVVGAFVVTTVVVDSGTDKQLHAEERIGAALYLEKHDGFGFDTRWFCAGRPSGDLLAGFGGSVHDAAVIVMAK
jgi:hypothetical protein